MDHDTVGMVKVLLRAPHGEVETLWATPVGEASYRLENSPFYAYRVSWLDVVEARPDATGFLAFERIVRKSGHRTVRLILVPGTDEAPGQQQVLDAVTALGCSWEGFNPRYYSIDVPPGVDLQAVADYLTRSNQQWEYADPTYDDLFPGNVGSGSPAT